MEYQSVAIPFIQFDPDSQKYAVDPKAIEFLSEIKTKLGVVSICGKYRTGKSYLMNKLLLEDIQNDKKNKGF